MTSGSHRLPGAVGRALRFAAAALLLAISLLVAASTVAAAATISVTVSDGSTSVDESGTTDTFDVVLSEQPATSAVVSLSSSDPGEVTVSPATLTFTTENWNSAQTVTVTGVDDGEVDSAQTVTITLSGLGVTSISTGNRETCAVTTSGGVKCWGDNGRGQLGDGTTTDRLIPVDVSGLTSGVTAIATGDGYACALMTSGGVKCWGLNNHGQLGDGTTTERSTPVDVSGLTSDVVSINAGVYYTCVVPTSTPSAAFITTTAQSHTRSAALASARKSR